MRGTIHVDSTKTDAAATAHKLLIAAAVVAVVPFGQLAALVLLDEAAYWGIIAQDPPAPDPAYRKAVTLVPRKLRALPAGDPTLSALRVLAQLSADIAAGHKALSTTEGRLLGARQAGARAAVKLQVRTYRQVLRAMRRAANQIPDSVRAMAAAANQDPRLSLARQRRALGAWRRGPGIPATVRAMWRKGRVPLRALKRLDAAVHRSVGKEAGREALSDTLSRIGMLVAFSVVRAERRAKAVLAGVRPGKAAKPDRRPAVWVSLTSRTLLSGKKGRSRLRARQRQAGPLSPSPRGRP